MRKNKFENFPIYPINKKINSSVIGKSLQFAENGAFKVFISLKKKGNISLFRQDFAIDKTQNKSPPYPVGIFQSL